VFATYRVRRRSTGEWVDVIEDGRLSALDDPDVVRIAQALGGSELLDYDWVPAVPGINYLGDYHADYAADPVAWIRRDQRGEFARADPAVGG
jgi:hypothetical protein